MCYVCPDDIVRDTITPCIFYRTYIYHYYFIYITYNHTLLKYTRSSWNTRPLLGTSFNTVTIIASTTHISDVTQLPFVKLKANSCHGILRTSFTLYYNGYCSGRCWVFQEMDVKIVNRVHRI
ncbi:uncharacterized protein LOC123263059 [Cotesia glomerata]|uniref:uncharacterized protein LOC123263059 n=1 Tax=Cotesia glomerata TaxID=32391 RepID=UPI001D00FAF3|nr:uncharacterized protein LOC123263059 [Cotesia glomerata]